MRFSKHDRAKVHFAEFCAVHKIAPTYLAGLCCAIRQAASAIVRLECNSDGNADSYRARVNDAAQACGMTVTGWDGVYPHLRLDNQSVSFDLWL